MAAEPDSSLDASEDLLRNYKISLKMLKTSKGWVGLTNIEKPYFILSHSFKKGPIKPVANKTCVDLFNMLLICTIEGDTWNGLEKIVKWCHRYSNTALPHTKQDGGVFRILREIRKARQNLVVTRKLSKCQFGREFCSRT